MRFSKVFACVVVAVVAAVAQTDMTASTMLANIIQPTRSVTGFSYSDSIHSSTGGRWYKAAELRTGAAAGYLEVHLVNDAATTWYKMPMTPGGRTAAMFDKIRQRNTNSTYKDSVVLFPIEDY